ncbi:rhamnogalacturonan acetylesterase [Streptomyces sp. NPDC051582]|uniref:rhamnogalacturonan acetylesterase n=1 Tax=Streptomyces sp. NPDC051582 TaxID=3155167 RepID=UPI003443C14B
MTYAPGQQERPPAPRRIFVAGDSVAVTRPHSYLPMAGWAQALPLFLTDAVEVVNCARARASSKSFRERGRLQWILDNLEPDDRLLFGFGQIDWKTDPGLHTKPFSTFQEHMAAYVHGARERGAHPVIVLPYERRRVDAHGNVARFLGDYPLAARQLAEDEHVPVVDLYGQSLRWWEELGPEPSKLVFTHLRPGEPLLEKVQDGDNVHLRAEGAIECARFVAGALTEQGAVPRPWVRDLDRRRFSYEEMGWLDEETFEHRTKSRVSEPAARKESSA